MSSSPCRIVVLGSGSEATLSDDYQKLVREGKAEKRTSPAVLLIHDSQKILLDCGPDIKEQLAKVDARPDLCVITHGHLDHIGGLQDLPQDTVKLVNLQHYKKFSVKDGNASIMAFPVSHSRISPTVGLKFFSDHLQILYCPDYLKIEEPDKVLPNSDLAILDGSALRRDIVRDEDVGHSSIESSIKLCRKYGIKNILFIHIGTVGANHEWLVSEVEKLTNPGETIIVSRDGMKFDLTSAGLEILEEARKLLRIGLYLVPRHAELVAKGEKTLMVKTKKFEAYSRIPIYLCSKPEGTPPDEGLVYAKIAISEPREITLDEFWKLQDKHKITDEEAKDFWGVTRDSAGGHKLYAYDIQLIETYDPPLRFKWQPGVQNWFSNIEFIGQEPKELKLSEVHLEQFKKTGIDEDLADPRRRWKQLIADLRYLGNSGWPRLQRGEPWGDFTKEDLLRYFAKCVDALRSVYFVLMPPKESEANYNSSYWDCYRHAKKYMKSKPPSEEEIPEWNKRRAELIETTEVWDPEDITPEILRQMTNVELAKLHDQLHFAFDKPGVNKETILNAYIFLKRECKRRGLTLETFDDSLEKAARKLELREDINKIVPFVVTYQAVSLSGSAAYDVEEPYDLDWVIRSPDRIPALEELLQKAFPEKTNHFVYELKGPSWRNYPVGDFVASPGILTEENFSELLGQRLPKYADLGPFIFISKDGDRAVLRVNSSIRDNGTALKLERLFQDLFLEVNFSLIPVPGEKVLANLYLRTRDKFELQPMNEPEFEPFYKMKPKAFEEAKAEKVVGEVSLKFGEWFPPVKVAAGYAPEESMDPDSHWRYFIEPIIRRDGYVLLQQKFDGERMMIHVDKERKIVKIFTEGALERKRKGLERSAYMPDVVEEALEKLRCKRCILDAEVTVLDEEGDPLPRHEITRLAVGKTPIVGEHIVFNCFDICDLDGKPPPADDYEKRLEMLDKVIPKDAKHFKKVETYKVKNRIEFERIYKKLAAIIGSEGIMSKTKKMPFFEKDGKTGEMGKLKVLFEIDVMIIGRRKIPAPKPPGKKVTAEEMEKALPDLKKKSNTWTFRCAFLGPDGKLWPLYSEKTYAPGDLRMRWDETRAKWAGTEDPSEWEMMEGFPNSVEGAQAYGNTYNFAPAEGEPEPKLGTIITVAPVIMRAWESDGSVMVSWTFPKCRRLYPEADKPMDWKVINNVLVATAKRHGKKAEILIGKDMKRAPLEGTGKSSWEEYIIFDDIDDYLAEVKQPFGSPGGKKFMVKRLLQLIPKHRRYVEPFGGAAALLFAKEPSEEEIYSDLQPEYPFILRALRGITDDEIMRLRRKDWTGSKERWKRFRMEGWRAGGDKIDKLYRLLYLIKFGWGNYWTDKFGYAEKRVSPRFFDTLPAVRERLKNVKILNRDAYKLVPELDSKDTFFYLDPPYDIDFYVKVKGAFGGRTTDLKKLLTLCKGIRGKFLLSINDSPEIRRMFRGFHQRALFTRKTSAGYSTIKGKYLIPASRRRELLISNYSFDKFDEAKEADERDLLVEMTGYGNWSLEDLLEFCYAE